MSGDEPCVEFKRPKDGLYAAYCDKCGFSRTEHAAAEEREFIYGYGRTKHIRDPYYLGKTKGLCGAFGGYPTDEPERPLCKRCERKAAAGVAVSGEGEGE